VQIDVRGDDVGRRTQAGASASLETRRPTLRALLPRLKQNQYQQHLKDSLEHYRKNTQKAWMT